MRRREIIAACGAGAVTLLGVPAIIRGQAGDRPRQVAIIQPQRPDDDEARAWVEAFRAELRQLGWREPETIEVEQRWYGGDLARLRADAAEVARRQPDVIFCMSTPTVAALRELTHAIPIVFVNANDPVGSGFVSSMARPGSNATGFVAFEPSIGEKWLELLNEIAPAVRRVGLVFNPRTHTGQHFPALEAAARRLGVRLERLEFTDDAELTRGLDGFAREAASGLLVMPDSSARVLRETIVRAAARHGLPAVYPYRLFVTIGGLAYYGTDTTAQFRKAADYVNRILRGAPPGELPVQAPTAFELVIHRGTARALGLTLPPLLLARADEVIE